MKMAVVHSCLQLRETFNGKRQLRGLELNRLRFDGQRKDRRWQHFNPSTPRTECLALAVRSLPKVVAKVVPSSGGMAVKLQTNAG